MGHAMSCTKKTSHNNESNEMSYIGFPPCQLNDCTCSSLVKNSVIHTRSNDPKHLKKARLKKQIKWKKYDQAASLFLHRSTFYQHVPTLG